MRKNERNKFIEEIEKLIKLKKEVIKLEDTLEDKYEKYDVSICSTSSDIQFNFLEAKQFIKLFPDAKFDDEYKYDLKDSVFTYINGTKVFSLVRKEANARLQRENDQLKRKLKQVEGKVKP